VAAFYRPLAAQSPRAFYPRCLYSTASRTEMGGDSPILPPLRARASLLRIKGFQCMELDSLSRFVPTSVCLP